MIRIYDPSLERACRDFLDRSPKANYCHDPAWLDVIREAYGKEAFAFVRTDPVTGKIRGYAPACHLASAAFGRHLVALPYLDYGGILAEDLDSEDVLREKLLSEAVRGKAGLEIRSRFPLAGLPVPEDGKVCMILPLREEPPEESPEADWTPVAADEMEDGLESEEPWIAEGAVWSEWDGAVPVDAATYPIKTGTRKGQGGAKPAPDHGANAYWKSLDAKVRNQVRKAEKSGVTVSWGREEHLDEFYEVFCVNMRDLGSPTHAKGFFAAVLKHFPGASIGIAHREGKCIGGLFRILWKDELVIPWASTLKEERVHCPNNALYWEAIQFAFERDCARVDFGRSTKDEGTYRFKKQWLARESNLYRYQFDDKGHFLERAWHVSQGKLGWTRNVWAKLPLKLANALGPMVRGSISA
ncbi:MAG: GNAT family N-acetyltransferase [Fibrobacteres bacterium]|nr:GNAT family N-acetyltransferase [Fibrobacterota bacterium]